MHHFQSVAQVFQFTTACSDSQFCSTAPAVASAATASVASRPQKLVSATESELALSLYLFFYTFLSSYFLRVCLVSRVDYAAGYSVTSSNNRQVFNERARVREML